MHFIHIRNAYILYIYAYITYIYCEGPKTAEPLQRGHKRKEATSPTREERSWRIQQKVD